VIPNINNDQLRLDTALVSQASCTTGGAATILKPLAEGIEGFEIFPGSTLLTTHGVTASDNAPDLVGNFQMGETGANKALKVVFGEKRLPGIMHVTGSADRAAFLAPSKIQLTLTVAAKDEELSYQKLRAMFEAATRDSAFRMMLGLYYPQDGEKKILGTKFKGEGRTAVLVADPSNMVVAKLAARAEDGRAMYNIVLKKILYDNVFGYVGNTLDLISLIVNQARVLPAPLQPIDKLRLPWVEPVFQIGRRFMIPVTELEKIEKAMEQARETYESSFVA
jgi:glyceraldehyde-3-phosphate dehydrogenase/erythrose-4-phosphate dehydrogenase